MNPSNKWLRYTYGNLPEEKDFYDQYKLIMGGLDVPYKICNDKVHGNVDFNAIELYRELQLLNEYQYEEEYDESLDEHEWISCILQTLNIEWI